VFIEPSSAAARLYARQAPINDDEFDGVQDRTTVAVGPLRTMSVVSSIEQAHGMRSRRMSVPVRIVNDRTP